MPERIMKVVISAVLVAAFGVVGFIVAEVRPFELARGPHDAGDGRRAPGDGVTSELPLVPVPPDTELTFNTSAGDGLHQRYESRLSAEGLRVFYTNEMPAFGWTPERDIERPVGGGVAPVHLLFFKAGGARCIIGVEESGPFAAVANVLVFDVPRGSSRAP